jgi:hypothetical protein
VDGPAAVGIAAAGRGVAAVGWTEGDDITSVLGRFKEMPTAPSAPAGIRDSSTADTGGESDTSGATSIGSTSI